MHFSDTSTLEFPTELAIYVHVRVAAYITSPCGAALSKTPQEWG